MINWKIILKFNIVSKDEFHVESSLIVVSFRSLTWILLRGRTINSYFHYVSVFKDVSILNWGGGGERGVSSWEKLEKKAKIYRMHYKILKYLMVYKAKIDTLIL